LTTLYLFKFALEAVASYYQEAPPFMPDQEDFKRWVATLNELDQELYRTKGLYYCAGFLSFRRHYYELRGYRLETYLEATLCEEAMQVARKNELI